MIKTFIFSKSTAVWSWTLLHILPRGIFLWVIGDKPLLKELLNAL
jgi:hypothetical protein